MGFREFMFAEVGAFPPEIELRRRNDLNHCQSQIVIARNEL